MAEALFAKYSKGGANISNKTKEMYGLGPNGTLDEILQSISYKSESQGTIIATVQWPDGTPVANSNVRMTSASGENYVYRTSNDGEVVFKTAAGQAYLNDIDGFSYFDLRGQNVDVACPVGSVNRITLTREKNLVNGGNYLVNANRWCNFSSMANSAEVTVVGGEGQRGTPLVNLFFEQMGFGGGQFYPTYTGLGSGKWYFSFDIGWSGPSGAINNLHGFMHGDWGLLPGGSGQIGNTESKSVTTLSNNRFNVILGAGGFNSEFNHTKVDGFTGYFKNGSYLAYLLNNHMSPTNNYMYFKMESVPGVSGGTTSAFGIIANGGAGGVKNTGFPTFTTSSQITGFLANYNKNNGNRGYYEFDTWRGFKGDRNYVTNNIPEAMSGFIAGYIGDVNAEFTGHKCVIGQIPAGNSGYVWINNFHYK